jgi:hypothetical protein
MNIEQEQRLLEIKAFFHSRGKYWHEHDDRGFLLTVLRERERELADLRKRHRRLLRDLRDLDNSVPMHEVVDPAWGAEFKEQADEA